MFMVGMIQFENERDKLLFERIYDTYEKRMYAAAYRLMHSNEKAEDVVHDAFVKIILHFETCKRLQGDELDRWICTVTKNTALDALRRDKKNAGLDDALDSPALDDVESECRYKRLLELVQELPDAYRDIVTLKYVCEWKDADIAAKMGMTQGAVSARLHRCRKALLKKMREEGYDYGKA